MSSWIARPARAVLTVLVLGLVTSAGAFEAQTVTIKVGFGAGGAYDASARLVARHLGRFLPGEPDVIVQNVPGGGSMRLTQLMLGSEPADGSVLATVSSSMAFAPEFDPENADFDPLELHWVAALTSDQNFCLTMKESGIETLEEFLTQDFTVGATGRSSLTYIMAAMVRNGLDAKFRIVTGFEGTADIELAMQRGEIAGYCALSYSSLMSGNLVDELNVIGRFGTREEEGFTGLPRFSALIEDPLMRQAAEMIESPLTFHLPFLAPLGIAPDTLAVLRDAFAAMVEDSEFLTDAQRITGLVIRFTPGAEMGSTFAAQLAADPMVFEAARQLVR